MKEGKAGMGMNTALASGAIALDGLSRVLVRAGGGIWWYTRSLMCCL